MKFGQYSTKFRVIKRQFSHPLFFGTMVFAGLFLFAQSVFSQDLASSMNDVLPFEVEGVYHARGLIILSSKIPEIVEFKITILQSSRTGDLNLTVASEKTRAILFFASEVDVQRSNNVVEIKSFGVTFKGIRQFMVFNVDVESRTIEGEIEGNFIENDKSIFITGVKEESIFEFKKVYGRQNCGTLKDYIGTFKGTFLGEEANLYIHQVPAMNGPPILSANITSHIKILYHDGFFSESLGLVTFFNDITYPMNGKSKKLVLVCDQSATHWILTGIHLASNGNIIREILFKKKK